MNWLEIFRRNTNGKAYMPLVDGIRFVAIMLVLFQHLNERLIKFSTTIDQTSADGVLSFAISRGTIGVFIFFVLSGFIISLPFTKDSYRKKFAFSSYVSRRLTRLEPPYLIWMTVWALVLVFKTDASWLNTGIHWLASIFYVHQIAFGEYSIINPVAWSLEVEIQFYLIAPLLFKAYYEIKKFKSRSIATALFVFIWITVQHYFGWHLMPMKASLLGYFHLFVIGVWMSDAFKNSNVLERSLNPIWDVLVLISLPVMGLMWTEELVKTYVFALTITIFFVGLFKGAYFYKVLSNPLVTVIGGMCYTIYLVHLPIMEGMGSYFFSRFPAWAYELQLAIAIISSISLVLVISGGAYLLIEKPFMSGSISFKPIKSDKKAPAAKVLFSKELRIIIILLVGAYVSKADSNNEKVLRQNNILPLAEIIMLAENNSMINKSIDANQEEIREEIKIQKKNWMDHVFITSSVSTGKGQIADNLYTTDDIGQTYLDRRNTTFNVGLNVFLPISKVASRRNNIKARQYRLEALEYSKEEANNKIRSEVIRHYNELKYQMNTIKMYAEKMEINKATMDMAEKYFSSARIDIEAYRSTVDSYYSSQLEYEKAKKEIDYRIKMLEELAGETIIVKK
ncbi:acyltransferase family protein [Reichenbachiella versicolor]|uniref:acyltransferase family protein n=1 Tax=Reichenbachiella versicolor TaxID=1821036 RepID=UPI000D6DD151|nr:acyltransferase family protein [Reichenbachiella versicolor]